MKFRERGQHCFLPIGGRNFKFLTSWVTNQDCLYNTHWFHLPSQWNPEFVYFLLQRAYPSWKARHLLVPGCESL